MEHSRLADEAHPVIGEEEILAVNEVLKSGRLSGFAGAKGEKFYGGEKIKQFEKEFADYFNTKYAVTFNSCTSALFCATRILNVRKAIVSPYTFVASVKCVRHPVFSDISLEDYGIHDFEGEIKDCDTLLPVHLFGHSCDLDYVMYMSRKHGLNVIEDCAQSIGAKFRDKYVGTFGDVGVFSFDSRKTITTGEGGMLITNNKDLYEKACQYRNHGEMVEGIMGGNLRMTEFQAAMGIVQFRKLDELNERRRDLCNYLSELLFDVEEIETPLKDGVFFVYALKIATKELRDYLSDQLGERGIYFGKGYVKPLTHLFNSSSLPNAEYCYDHVLATDRLRFPVVKEDIDFIYKNIMEILNVYRMETNRHY